MVNNSANNEDIATKFEADYRRIPLHFSYNERRSMTTRSLRSRDRISLTVNLLAPELFFF
jgi:hypothetical protein